MALFVKKLIANFEIRTEVPSSQDEFDKFLLEGDRPDFEDSAVIAVKFIFSDTEDFSNAEESSWFISPSYVEELHDADADVDFTIASCSATDFGFDTDDDVDFEDPDACFISTDYIASYGPSLAAEIPPEILLVHTNCSRRNLDVFRSFHLLCLQNNVLLRNMPIKEIIDKFVVFANSQD